MIGNSGDLFQWVQYAQLFNMYLSFNPWTTAFLTYRVSFSLAVYCLPIILSVLKSN